jgi:hypothetical protein
MGNIFGKWVGSEEQLASVATGSHTDAIPLSGMYDGTVGVLGGIAAVAALKKAVCTPRMDAAHETRLMRIRLLSCTCIAGVHSTTQHRGYHVHFGGAHSLWYLLPGQVCCVKYWQAPTVGVAVAVANFTLPHARSTRLSNMPPGAVWMAPTSVREGKQSHPTACSLVWVRSVISHLHCTCSRAMAGMLPPSALTEVMDDKNLSFVDALQAVGHAREPDAVAAIADARSQASHFSHFVELHIEQGAPAIAAFCNARSAITRVLWHPQFSL